MLTTQWLGGGFKYMKLIITIFSLLMFVQSANAKWVELFKDGNETYSIDRDSMSLDLENERAKVWVKNTLKTSKPKPNEVVEGKTYFDIVCKQRTLNLITMVSYNSQQKVVKSFNPTIPKPINAIPDTVGGNIFNAICQDLIPTMKDQPFAEFTSSVLRADQCLKKATDSKKYSILNKSKLKGAVLEDCDSVINTAFDKAVSYASIEKGQDLTYEEAQTVKSKVYDRLSDKLDTYIQ